MRSPNEKLIFRAPIGFYAALQELFMRYAMDTLYLVDLTTYSVGFTLHVSCRCAGARGSDRRRDDVRREACDGVAHLGNGR